jgi:hypothetical protein
MKTISDAIVAGELELIKKQPRPDELELIKKQKRVGRKNKQGKAKQAKQGKAKPQQKRVAGRPTPK